MRAAADVEHVRYSASSSSVACADILWTRHDDMIHTATSDELRDQFISEYREDFNITLEDAMSTFLGMEIEHNKENIAIHLDTYIQETLAEYKAAVTKNPQAERCRSRSQCSLE